MCGIGVLKLSNIIKEPLIKGPVFKDGTEEYYYLKSGKSYNFAAILKCGNKKCLHTVSMIGEYIEDYEDYDEETFGTGLFCSYFPKYFFPNLKIFKFPDKVPPKIQEEIFHSFSNFFADPLSAANKIRRAIELLVSEFGAPKYTFIRPKPPTAGKRKKHYFDLHTRIVKLTKSKRRTTNMLLGLKVIGNDGSHANESSINHDDILEAYEVLEFLLEKEFSEKANEILKIAEKLKNRN